jgi:hypothetical protein
MEVVEAKPPTPKKQQQKKGKPAKSPLDKVAAHSKNIHKKKAKKNRFQRFTEVPEF